MTVNEPVVAYEMPIPDVSISDKWNDYCTIGAVPNSHPSTFGKFNPNVAFHCTQEEFIAHIREIEQGEFMSWEEAEREFEAWRKEYLASRGIII